MNESRKEIGVNLLNKVELDIQDCEQLILGISEEIHNMARPKWGSLHRHRERIEKYRDSLLSVLSLVQVIKQLEKGLIEWERQ